MSRLAVPALALLLAACTSAPGPSAQPDTAPSPEPAETAEARGAAVGLAAAQVEALRALGPPALVPRAMEGYTLEAVEIDEAYRPAVSYTLRWRRADGACVEVLGTNDGIGGPDYPIVSAEVAMTHLPGAPRARVYQAAADPQATSAQNWGPETVVSDFVTVGEEPEWMAVWLLSSDANGCRPIGLEAAASVLASLRPLAPDARLAMDGVMDGGALGAFADADDALVDLQTDLPLITDPEADVAQALAGWEAQSVRTETVRQSDAAVHVLATLTGLMGDSVRDERLLLVFIPDLGGWQLLSVGRQVRCHAGRGHQDWSADLCL